jgi:phosphatidylinositol glycan class T
MCRSRNISTWNSIANKLSGISCSSVNLLKPNVVWNITSQETIDSLNKGPYVDILNGAFIRQGSLPLETVCTENLTPFLKLLPCFNKVSYTITVLIKKAGLAQLIEPHKFQKSNYLSLVLDIVKKCHTKPCSEYLLEVKQVITQSNHVHLAYSISLISRLVILVSEVFLDMR